MENETKLGSESGIYLDPGRLSFLGFCSAFQYGIPTRPMDIQGPGKVSGVFWEEYREYRLGRAYGFRLTGCI